MIKKMHEARAYQEVNCLIDEGENILETCRLENFLEDGGAPARRDAIEAWVTNAEPQLVELLIDRQNAIPFGVARLQEAIQALNPQPPSAAQLRHLFADFVNERLRLLNAMIGRDE